MLTIQLEKPLGLILEEVEKNQPRGVYILELDDDGSAASSQWLQGMKQKLGNCGGGGQCTFCAVDFVDSEGWNLRS